jgi:DNA gyrase/topoisomerase IV subunit B
MSKDEIKRLSSYSHVRLRSTMYLGSTAPHTQVTLDFTGEKAAPKEFTWVPAVATCAREIWENSLDEVIAHGHGSRIDVTYDPDTMTFSVEDDGRGIPIDWDETNQMHKATLALSELMAGRNFDERTNTAGMNGIGASGVNFCSEYFLVDIHRDGQRFQQKFEEGNEIFGDALQVGKPKITSKQGKSGTRITFKLSPTVFKDLTLPLEFLKSRLTEIAHANPNVKFRFNGEQIRTRKGNQSLFSGYDTVLITANVPDKQFDCEFILVPQFVETGDISHSLVNNIPVLNGGTQIDAFKKYFVVNLLNNLARESKRRGLTPNRTDVLDTLLIYNVTRMLKPDFDSQSKTRLINEEVEVYIRTALDDDKLYKRVIRDHKTWIDSIYERCAARTQKKDDAETAKLARKVLRTKVPKLMDATGKDRTKCILALCEGDSALSMMSAVRDPEVHGGLPLRGKILNVRGESNKTILDNVICQDIMSSIGLVLGQKMDRSMLRYGQVWITCDADTDGANIMALLCNFFHLGWPELFDPDQPPFFYVFSTPFIIQEDKKGVRHYWYSDDVHEYDPNDWKGCTKPTRAKGLGSLEEVDWANSLAKPRLIPLVDDGNLASTLDRIFHKDKADDRKAWMGV